ncbi:MAG: CDP-diacylglycerol--glycerol-3-phosphate 3-phosphatidyltransferase [Chlamydiia bacterium]|nr:CDP-diacylglycerol--glycerol-3-phosphate 3-phosphatidyltransferase [Chlamydiia bacterium]MCH9619054.1 CDP-diacylglycerol--glycerol-3-phosphate 3-phosphatidyltransferase [Chlamydiia bacterium]MCH9624821.1 CDP-diacylglycerol--glycerol-3-phosphate 3-phosphatidyltransferase [Chlamydiia bacterium]
MIRQAPLIITLSRIALCPVFLVIYLFYNKMGIPLMVLPYILLIIVAILELTDIFDGHIARKTGQVTTLGKILDPMADSIVRLSVLLTFTQGLIKLPVLLTLLFVFREIIISTLRTLCALNGHALAARFSGKLKAVIQAIAIIFILLMIIPYSLGYITLASLQITSAWVIGATAFYTILSGLEYLYIHRNDIKASLTVV